jgi:hypothetical protein
LLSKDLNFETRRGFDSYRHSGIYLRKPQKLLDFPHAVRIGVVVGWLNLAAHEDGLASRFCGALVSASVNHDAR